MSSSAHRPTERKRPIRRDINSRTQCAYFPAARRRSESYECTISNRTSWSACVCPCEPLLSAQKNTHARTQNMSDTQHKKKNTITVPAYGAGKLAKEKCLQCVNPASKSKHNNICICNRSPCDARARALERMQQAQSIPRAVCRALGEQVRGRFVADAAHLIFVHKCLRIVPGRTASATQLQCLVHTHARTRGPPTRNEHYI